MPQTNSGIRRSEFGIRIISFLAVMLVVAHAPVARADENLESQKATIARVEKYLSGITSLVADFTQVAPDGSLASGKFFLKRPGKMRWQYNPPTPVLMVSNGETLTYYDYELDQISHMPLDNTLAGFLAKDKIRFGGAAKLLDFRSGADSIRATIIQKERPKDGTLTLEFSDKPLKIQSMVLTDSMGQITSIKLQNAQFGVKFEDSLFIFDNPRVGGIKRSYQR